ncbi:transient receptor potential cation channel subfamily V member 3-like [Saccostrea echinata]|uniref:transient receptor potential cation channel subfamily V member 3-like n=1 Tax=Saccostrea echinata TaxID=191078 RepID=UPI002A820763|nr:transient receptor potential cation channel subfamily V member 3-like [Saccostrea echinata]
MGNKVSHRSTVEAEFAVTKENDDETKNESESELKQDPLFENLKKNIEERNKLGILKQIKEVIKQERVEDINQMVQSDYNRETLLHITIKNVDIGDLSCVEDLLAKNAELVVTPRDNSDYNGQTALHVAIVIGNFEVVKILLDFAEAKDMTGDLLNICANGSRFKNTALMGQLPLSVAALVMKENDSNSKRIIDVILEKKASLCAQNTHGDTVFHSLIKYGDIYPEKICHVKRAFKYLREKYEELKDPIIEDILFCENNEGLTPLQLSAKLGVGEIFACIIEVPQVYRFQNTQDGLFDIRVYDVTEFDRMIMYIDRKDNSEWNPSEITILERLFDEHCTHKEAFQILNLKLVQFILQKKWKTYRVPLFIWLVMHLSFISISTLATVQKSTALVCSIENQNNCELQEDFYPIGIMFLLVGMIYFVFSSLIFHKLLLRCYFGGFGLIWHNLDYIICLTVVSFGAIIESVLTFLRLHWDYHLVCILLCGWYFMLYFSPFHKNFVSFTYMLKAGLVKDFLPFSFVFIFLLMSFTTVMHILFHGTEEDPEEFNTFRDSLFTMFKLGVALDDIGVLSQSRIPWLAYTMFVLFAILSFIHILNALIAIMSQTFSDVHQQKHLYLQYQKLCMIELFEDIIITPYLEKVVPCIYKAKHWTRKMRGNGQPRYFTTVHSLDDSYYNRSEKEEIKKTSNQDMETIIDFIQTSRNLPTNQTGSIEKDVTYIQTVEKRDKSFQIPHVKSSSAWVQLK